MMKIKVLGPSCANCKRVEQIARREVEKLGLTAEFEKVTDYGQIMAYGVMSTPGLVIDEKVVALSLPELLILKRVIKLRLIIIFIGIVAFAIILTGYLFNFVIR